jgi:hypothetical protein
MALRFPRNRADDNGGWRYPQAMTCTAALLLVPLALVASVAACKRETPVELYVDKGFDPKDVRFEIEDLGPVDGAKFDELSRRPDIDGTLRLPEGTCSQPCQAAIVSVFMHNKGAEPVAPPVVRLKAPDGKPERLPIAFRDKQINQGRIGRIRWLVRLYPEEKSLTATVTSSVFLVEPTKAPEPKDGGP